MNKEQVMCFIREHYRTNGEHPWMKYPNYTVYRHCKNRKWFAVVMEIPKSTLGIEGNGSIDILNVKCGPIILGSLRKEKGFYPAYHMNKVNWITVALDDTVDDEKIRWLIHMSFELTDNKKKQN